MINQSSPPIFDKGYEQCELLTPMRFDGDIGELVAQLRETVRTGIFKPITTNESVIHLNGPDFKEMIDYRFAEQRGPDYHKVICWKNDSVRAYNDYIRTLHYKELHFVVGETVVTNQPILSQGKMVYSTDEYAKILEILPDVQHGVVGHWYKLDRECAVFQASHQHEVKTKLRYLAQSAKQNRAWHTYFAAKEFFADLRAVHACTTHKSQGSSYNAAFVDLTDIGECGEWETVARMLYVAISRAKHRVYLYGSLPAKYDDWDHKTNPIIRIGNQWRDYNIGSSIG